jgi:protein gp37
MGDNDAGIIQLLVIGNRDSFVARICEREYVHHISCIHVNPLNMFSTFSGQRNKDANQRTYNRKTTMENP